MIVRALKGLNEMVSISVVHWLMLEHGWTFAEGPGTVPDTVNGASLLHQVYTAADPHIPCSLPFAACDSITSRSP
ncbi:glutathionyl-hydroquinone reductase [Paraburkholderia sp. UCT70]